MIINCHIMMMSEDAAAAWLVAAAPGLYGGRPQPTAAVPLKLNIHLRP